MHKSHVVCAAVLLLILPLLVAAQAPGVDFSFTIAMSRPHTHLFDIDMAIKRPADGPENEAAHDARLDTRLLLDSRV